MKILIVAGGGGHFAPALAVIEKLSENDEILLVGRKHAFEGDSALSFEYQTAMEIGIPFKPVTTGRIQRKLTRHSLNFLLKTPVGIIQSVNILKKFKPDVVLSFGGYVAFPITLAASILRIPVVIHEQTLGAGSANKLASFFAKRICISWKESRKYFPQGKTILTGNPIRNSEFKIKNSKLDNKKLPLIYVTGGSGGAHAINLLIEGCIENLLSEFYVIHQTGDAKEFGDFERLNLLKEKMPKNLKERYEIMKFISKEDVFEIIENCDLVVSRSGMNTVSEILFFGKPSLLIPLPYGQKGEQLKNAEFAKKVGISEIGYQKTLTSNDLYLMIKNMFQNIEKYKRHSDQAKKLIKHDAADKIIKAVKDAINN